MTTSTRWRTNFLIPGLPSWLFIIEPSAGIEVKTAPLD
jgi:hypothetical protein